MRFDISDAKELVTNHKELNHCPLDKVKSFLEFTERLLFGSESTNTKGVLFVDEDSKECKSPAWKGRNADKKAAIKLVAAHNLIILQYPDKYKNVKIDDYSVTKPGRDYLFLKSSVER